MTAAFLTMLTSAVTATGCGANDRPIRIETGGSEQATISAADISFSIDSITVPAAATATITFQNNDSVEHTFTVFLGEEPEGEIVADSGPVAAGETAEVVVLFGTPGRHAFACQIHPEQMQGVLIVQ